MKKISLICFAALILSSCFGEKDNRVYRLSALRGPIPGSAVVTKNISRQDYTASLNNLRSLERLRLVPILINSKTEGAIPEYRLFDIQPGSPADILGIKNADVLVAANDFVIYEPPKFKTYLQLLSKEKTAEIEIRREGQPILFKYNFE